MSFFYLSRFFFSGNRPLTTLSNDLAATRLKVRDFFSLVANFIRILYAGETYTQVKCRSKLTWNLPLRANWSLRITSLVVHTCTSLIVPTTFLFYSVLFRTTNEKMCCLLNCQHFFNLFSSSKDIFLVG